MENVKNAGRAEMAALMERILYEVKKVVVGQDHFLERVLVAILAQGHLLVEGVPGLAKTLTVKTLARTIRGTFKRIQFTPDLVPADLVGTRIYNQKTGDFATSLGPVFTNLLLADEINRAPAKVQSALLEVMQEYQVTIAGQTHLVPAPFLTMATQNPIETEGTYPLPEAQVDRFMMKVLVGYPTEEEEFVIVDRVTGVAEPDVAAVATTDQLSALQRDCRKSYVDPSLMQYAVRLAAATRFPERHGLAGLSKYLSFGASPRAPIHTIEGAKALAYLRGRTYVLPEDVTDLVPDVFRHRLVLTYQALSEGKTADDLIRQVMQKIPAPEKPLEAHVRLARENPRRQRLRGRPSPSRSSAGSSGPSSGASTGPCTATTGRFSAASASTSPTSASTSTRTTSATSTGTSPRGSRPRTSASTTRTARSPGGSCST